MLNVNVLAAVGSGQTALTFEDQKKDMRDKLTGAQMRAIRGVNCRHLKYPNHKR